MKQKETKKKTTLLVALSASFVLMLAFAGTPRSHALECASIVAESLGTDSRFVKLHLSNAEGCITIYGLYVQIERNGSIQGITHTPSGWTYGEVEKAAFWTTETEPIDSDSKMFGIKLQTQKPYTLHWIAVDQAWSPIAEGVLVGQR
ncbi:MAG: hypothetical protein ACE5J2_06485 [Nitrososphaerales archaeon]